MNIIELAKECGVHEHGPLTRNWSFELSQLERFADLVRKEAIEECAKVCDDKIAFRWEAPELASAIRSLK